MIEPARHRGAVARDDGVAALVERRRVLVGIQGGERRVVEAVQEIAFDDSGRVAHQVRIVVTRPRATMTGQASGPARKDAARDPTDLGVVQEGAVHEERLHAFSADCGVTTGRAAAASGGRSARTSR